MKKLFLLLMFSILLVGSISAMSFDNVKSYDKATQTITIKNAFGLPLIGSNIASIKLNTPSVNKIGFGYQKVAEFEVNSYTDYLNVLSGMKLYDLNNGNKKIDRELDYFYKTDVQVPKYEEICDKVININKSIEKQNCKQVENGTENTFKWEALKSWDFVKDKKIVVGIFTDVKSGDKVEWVPTLFGRDINEWAVWDAGLNNGLVAYYDMQNTTLLDLSGHGNSGTNVGATTITGKLGMGLNFTSTQYALLPNMTGSFTTSASFNTWIKTIGLATTPWDLGNSSAGESFANGGNWYTEVFKDDRLTIPVSVTNLVWAMATVTQTPGANGYKVYINGANVYNGTGENIVNINTNGMSWQLGRTDDSGVSWIYFYGDFDEMGFWNRELTQAEVTQLYNGGTGINYTATAGDTTAPRVTLESPIDAFNSTSSIITFAGTASDNINLTSVSLYLNGTLNQTNSSGFNNTQYNFTLTLAEGYYNWTYEAKDNASQSKNATTRTFTINLNEINVTLISPLNNYLTSQTNVSFNASATGNSFNLTNATLYLWFSNGTSFLVENVNATGTGTNDTAINVTLDGFTSYLWNYKFCGVEVATICVFAPSNFTLTFSPFSENSVNYTLKNVLETSRQTFTINISANPLISAISGKFLYNGSYYTANISTPSSGIYISTDTIDIPLQTIEHSGNKSFLWQFNTTLADSSTALQNTTTYNQKVNRTYIEFCNGTYPETMVNFTTKSAENPFPTTAATFKSSWNWYISGGNGDVRRNASYENITEQASSFAFCTKNYSQSYNVNTNIEVDASGFAKNFHYLTDAILTNNSNNISIYLLNDSKATLTVLKARDKSQNPLENISIQVQLYDIGTDGFYTVAMAKTTFNGEDTVYLNWYDSLYKFILTQNGAVVKSTTPYKIAETPQIFEVSNASTFSFDKFRDFQYNLYYNNGTHNFVLTFTKPAGLVDQGCLRVIRRTAQNDTVICESCESSSSATLYCNIGTSVNGTYIASFYATGSWYLVDWISEVIGSSFSSEIYDLLGAQDATTYAFLFSGVIISLFLISPVLAIVGAILALLGAAALGFTLMDYSIYMGMIILGGIMIWILKR